MRIILLFIFTILLSCSNNYSENKSIKFNIDEDLTFDEFKMMENNVSALYKIINEEGNSKIVQFDNKSFLND